MAGKEPPPKRAPPPKPARRPPELSEASGAAAAREQETLLAPPSERAVTLERVKGSPPAVGARREPDKYIGTTIDGRYIVESVLGEGGMGVVYKCRRKVFDRPAALKILRADLAKNPEVLERFVTEAKAASGIGNRHIVDVFDFGEVPDGSTYFAMEYLDGETLGARLARGPLPSDDVVYLGRQLAEGLAAAHAAQIVHRDLKPDNVFITSKDQRDFVKILDFGIAKVIGIENKITRAGAVFGTPHYMSPEQCRGSSVDHRTDVYSLGIILYEMAVGHVPFDAENPLSILSMHLNEAPRRFHEVAPELAPPPGLENLILKCLAKDPSERFASMHAVEEALAAIERGELVEIEVPISVAPPSDEEAADVELPKAAPPPSLGDPRAAVPTSSVPGRTSFVADVPPSLPPWERASLTHDPVEESLRRAAADAEAEREWHANGRGKSRTLALALGGLVLLGFVSGYLWLAGGDVPSLHEAFQAGRPLVLHQYEGSRPASQGEVTKVAMVVSPIDAHVFQAGRDLGVMPVDVSVPKGGSVEVEVKRDGFWTKKLTLDGQRPRVTVRLAPVSSAKAAPSANAAKAPAAAVEEPAPASEPEAAE